MIHPASSILHSIKDQMRSVKYSIRAEATEAGSSLPRMLQRRDIRRLTTLGSVVSVPAMRLADGLVTRVETMAYDLLRPARGNGVPFPRPVSFYLPVEDDAALTDKLFQALKRIVDRQGIRNNYVSEQGLDATGAFVRSRLQAASPDAGQEDVLPPSEDARALWHCALIAHALHRTTPVRAIGSQSGAVHAGFARAPNLYAGAAVGLTIAVATLSDDPAQEVDALIESVESAVNARMDRFVQAVETDSPIDAIAHEFSKLVAFLP